MSWVVKNLSFELNFWHKSKFLDFAQFHPLKVMQEQSNSRFQAKFSTRLKIFGFCQTSSFAGLEVVVKKLIFESNFQHKSIFLWILSNFILCWFVVVKTLIFKPNFQRDWKFLDFANFILHMCWVVKTLKILRQIFIATKNFWILPTFILHMSWVVKISFLSQIFNTNQSFSRFCQISSFAGLEFSKLS